MASKTALPNISKITWNCCIFSKEQYDVYIVGGLRSWSKCFFQTCVICLAKYFLTFLEIIKITDLITFQLPWMVSHHTCLRTQKIEKGGRGKGSICCWFGASSKTRLAPVPRFILYWSFRHGISNYIRNMTPMQKQKPFGVIAAKDSIILVSRMDLYWNNNVTCYWLWHQMNLNFFLSCLHW